MMYVDFTAGSKDYQLRLNTRNVVALEKQLGCNPLAIFPTITQMVLVLHASLQALQHGISLNDAYDIFDSYLEDGHSATDFITVILDVYKTSGLINIQMETDEEKN